MKSPYSYILSKNLKLLEKAFDSDNKSDGISIFWKYNFHSFNKISEIHFSKELINDEYLRKLMLYNIITYNDGNLQFSHLNVPHNLNNLFYTMVLLNENKIKSPLLISSMITECYVFIKKNIDVKIINPKNENEEKQFCYFEKSKEIEFDHTDIYLSILIYCYLLSTESQRHIFYRNLEREYEHAKAEQDAHYYTYLDKLEQDNSQEKQNSPETVHHEYPNPQPRRSVNPFHLSLSDMENLIDVLDSTKLIHKTFAQDVLDYCYKQGIFTGTQFENETMINQNEFSKIKNKIDYIPQKRIAISLCVGLRLTITESIELLKKAGYTLSEQIGFDRFIIENSLQPQYYDIEILNQKLDKEATIRKYGQIKERIGSMSRGHYNK